MGREAVIERATSETSVTVRLDLDGTGTTDVATGVPFFDHMLEALGRHAPLDLRVDATGDLAVDAHHTVEDVGICVGSAIAEALGDRSGIRRFGSASVPMDEALVLAAIDVSGRGSLTYELDVPIELVGTFDTTALAGARGAARREAHRRLAAGAGQDCQQLGGDAHGAIVP